MGIRKGIKKEWLILFLVILVSCSLQTLIAGRNKVPEYDEAIHYDLALNIAKTGLPILSDGRGTVLFHHPPLSFYLMAIPLFFSSSLFWGRVVGSLLSVFVILLTYFLGKKIGGTLTGLLAAFFLSIHSMFLTFAHSLYVEVYFGFFVITSIVFFFLAEEKKRDLFYLLAGITLGLAFLTKYLAVVLFLSFFVFFLLQKGRKVYQEKKLYLVLAPAGAIFLLWPLFGYLVNWSEFLGAINFWLSYGKNKLCDARVNVGLVKYFLAIGLALSPPFALASFLAFVSQALKRFREKKLADLQIFILIFIAFWFVFCLLMFVKDVKYLFPILPFLCIVLANSIRALRLTAKWVILGLIFLILFSPYDFLNLRKSPLNMRVYFSLYMWRIEAKNPNCFELGEYLRSISKENEVIFYTFDAAIGGFCSQRPYQTIGCSCRYKQAIAMLDEAKFVVLGPTPFFPYLTDEEKQKFWTKLEGEFFLAKTISGWGRVFIKNGNR